ncbi:MAG: creatininase family protein, partial [Armatimonadota bacterium]|nr:creatininase family protein [Armatimonadota bacterium]
MEYAKMTWPQLRALSRETVVIAPFGACEQHGPFLPFFTDALLVEAVAARAEALLGDQVLLLPTQWLGASQHHIPLGTLTADVKTHTQLVLETCESVLRDGFRRLFVLNGHGGNADTIRLALRQLDGRYPDAVLA